MASAAPAATTTSPTASDDTLSALLVKLADQLSQEKQEPSEIKKEHKSLEAIASATHTTEILARHLFTASSPSGSRQTLGGSESLAVLTYLVATDAAKYLKPSSRSVRNVAESLGSPGPTTGAVVATQAELSDETLGVIVSQLGGPDVESADNAAATLAALAKNLGPAVVVRCVESVSSLWETVTKKIQNNPDQKRALSTVSVRCASTVVDLVCLGDASMNAAVKAGSMDLVLGLVSDGDDPLMQMSALDLLEKMATTVPMHGSRAQWLFDRKVLNPLLEMAGSTGSPDSICGGPSLRTLSAFCKLAHTRTPQEASSQFGLAADSELLGGFHRALHCFEEQSSGENDRLAFVDAVSSWSSASPQALTLVIHDPLLREGWLSLNVSQPKLKSVILYSVATCIDPPSQVDSSSDTVMAFNVPSNQLSMRLFDCVGSVNGRDATDVVLSAANASFAELRLGAYALLNAVAKRGMGAQVLLSHNSFYEFLVNRENESTKEGKEAKHAIVEAVLASDAKPLLANNIVSTLEKIAQQGPHYVNVASHELATES
jgi:hypothetical protein